jgi:hypothetical protein
LLLILALGLILVLSILILATVMGTVLKRAWGPYMESRRQPVQSMRATVASKREEMVESYRHNLERRIGETVDRSDVIRMEPAEWYAEFECDDNETREFEVKQNVYESLIMGDTGNLSWQGHLFVSFTRPDSDSDGSTPSKTIPDDWR